MRLTFHLVQSVEAEDLPITYGWQDGGVPQEPTREEAEMVLLFEIAEALRTLAYRQRR
jgi:hypothetical protein